MSKHDFALSLALLREAMRHTDELEFVVVSDEEYQSWREKVRVLLERHPVRPIAPEIRAMFRERGRRQ